MKLSYFPQIKVVHTSKRFHGQRKNLNVINQVVDIAHITPSICTSAELASYAWYSPRCRHIQ